MDTSVTGKIIQYANQFNIDPALFMALIEQESDFNPNEATYEAEDNDYSIGLCQVEIGTAVSMGFQSSGDQDTDKNALMNPDTNLYYGARYLRAQMDKYSSLPLMNQVMTYNSGSPLDESSSFYAANLQYGENIMNYYAKWMNTFQFQNKGSYLKEFVLSFFLGGMAIYVDAKLNK